jgi:hypothetical protein
MSGLCLELLGDVVLGPPPAAAMRVPALVQLLLERVTLALAKIGHR